MHPPQHPQKPSHKRNISISTDSSTDDSTLVSSYIYNDDPRTESQYCNGDIQSSSRDRFHNARQKRSFWKSCIPYLVVAIFYVAIFATLIYIHGLTKKWAWQQWLYGPLEEDLQKGEGKLDPRGNISDRW